MISGQKMHRAFFWSALILLTLTLSACSIRPLRNARKGLFEDSGDRIASGQYDSPESVPQEEMILTGEWQWPLKSVEVSSHFGTRGKKFHQGVDLRAPIGTPVFAASDGTVVYVGTRIRGYGRMIVLKHSENFYSVYAHHSKNLVKVGKKVKMGDKIALSGRSGRASGPHLHFEIRKGTTSYDPYYAIRTVVPRVVASRRVASETPQ